MQRRFEIGDKVICKTSGVVGVAEKFYYPTACAEQTMVRTADGRLYHAPTEDWVKVQEAEMEKTGEAIQDLLNPYGQYLVNFAANHGMSIADAYDQPMIRARKAFFEATGM